MLWPHYGWSMHQALALLLVPDSYVLFQEHFQKPPGVPKSGSKWTSPLADPMQYTLVSLFGVSNIAEPLAT